MKTDDIPAPTIKRLSLYLRCLDACQAEGSRTISSKQLGERLNLTDAQVRKDLAYFGPFGHPGIGYRVDELILRIRRILGTDRTWEVVLVGAGNLGRALMAYRGFAKKGFELAAVFDIDASAGKSGDARLPVRPVRELQVYLERHDVRLGIVAVPAACAQEVADQMITGGIKGILNFAPVTLAVPSDVTVAGVDLAVQLEQLSFKLSGSLADVPLPDGA